MEAELRRDLLLLLRAPGFAPLLEALHAALVRHGEPRGRLPVPTREAADALADLVGREVRPGGSVAVAEVDRLLREKTRFRCSLQEAVELHHGAPLVRPRVERERARQAQARAVARCFALLPGVGLSVAGYARAVSWLHAGEAALRADAGRWGTEALWDAVRAVALVLDRMPGRDAPPVYLAELANEVAGDAHGLDAARPAGILLLRALEHQFPEAAARAERRTAAWRATLLAEAGIARDPISVRVDTFGLCGESDYLRALRREGVDRPLTLYSLAGLGGDLRAWRDVAFVVENPTVFAALVKHVNTVFRPENHPTLVCTNGNLNTADHQLLRLLTGAGAHLFYSGDFDARGLEIAATVLDRYPGRASPWRMTPADYRAALRGDRATLDPAALQRAGRLFPDLVREMGERRQAAHHEGLIDRLQADLDHFVTRGQAPPRMADGGHRRTGAAGVAP